MSAVVTSIIAAVSAFAAMATFLLYLHFGRRSDLAVAREEALALAETRRQVIGDLRERLKALEEQHRQAQADCALRIRELQAALDETRAEARNEAYQTQHFYAAALSELLNDLRTDLERTPPAVEPALAQIRKLLAGERPAA
jgi:flagellar biosynthesis/type III secretory pathway protein FliH